ncbi:MAG: DUF393 domain-containing protein [Pseudomonadota bacterium]
MTVETDPRAATRVYYDGGCPLCRREIGWYQGKTGADAIDWVNVAGDGTIDGPPGLTHEDLLRRFTVERRNGKTARGAAGFISLWRALPSTRMLAIAADNLVVTWFAERLYRTFLWLRPIWRPQSDKALGVR